MSYTISYRHSFNETSERWNRSFGEAKTEAINCVRSGVADQVEVRDCDGNLVYQYPQGRRTNDATAAGQTVAAEIEQ